MLVSYWVTRKLSTWLIPLKYYLCFPLSVYPVSSLKDHRKEIRNEKRSFHLCYEEKTFADGEYLGCTIPFNDFLIYWNRWKAVFEERKTNNDKTLIEISEVFDSKDENLIKLSNETVVEVENYVNIKSWEEYLTILPENKALLVKDNMVFSLGGKRYFKEFEKER